MKKPYLSYVNWMAIIVLSLGIFASSCSKEDAAKPNNENAVNLKKKSLFFETTGDDAPGLASTCDLIAGQHINVGQVFYWNDDDFLYVQYKPDYPTWKLYEVHLFVGSESEWTAVIKNGSPKIGHFPYSKDDLDGVDGITMKIPIEDSWDDRPIIAAHAVVKDSEMNEETAWSNCRPEQVLASKTYLPSIGWVITPGTSFGGSDWCGILGYSDYEIGQVNIYPLVDLDGDPVNANLKVSDNGADVTFEFVEFVDEEYVELDVAAAFVYFGSIGGIMNYLDGDCLNYRSFPIIGYSADFPLTINEILPLCDNNFPFDRSWGWYSTYCIQ